MQPNGRYRSIDGGAADPGGYTRPRRAAGVGMGALAVLLAGVGFATMDVPQARAMSSCTGTYAAALLHALTKPTIVALDLTNSAMVPENLARAFTRGMRAAGVTVTGKPTVYLRLSYEVVGQGGDFGGSGRSAGGPVPGWSSRSEGGVASLRGGRTLAMPDIPDYSIFSPRRPVQSSLLMLRAEARNIGADSPDWVATVQCTMQGTDNQTLAYQLGELIGGAIGKRRSNSPA